MSSLVQMLTACEWWCFTLSTTQRGPLAANLCDGLKSDAVTAVPYITMREECPLFTGRDIFTIPYYHEQPLHGATISWRSTDSVCVPAPCEVSYKHGNAAKFQVR